MTSRQMHHIDCALERRLVREVHARDLMLVDALRAGLDTVALTTVVRLGTTISGARLVFDDGLAIRLGPCHPGAVAALSAAVARPTPVTLVRVSRQRRLWSMTFAGERQLSLLAGSAAPVPGGGTLLLAAAA